VKRELEQERCLTHSMTDSRNQTLLLQRLGAIRFFIKQGGVLFLLALKKKGTGTGVQEGRRDRGGMVGMPSPRELKGMVVPDFYKPVHLPNPEKQPAFSE